MRDLATLRTPATPFLILGLLLAGTGCGPKGDGGDDGGSDGGGGPDFGEARLASLTEVCQGVAGLTGQSILDDRLEARAWRMVNGGAVGPLQILAVTHLSALGGTYAPDPAIFLPGDHTLTFSVVGPTGGQGGVGISDEQAVNLEAAVFLGRFAVGVWP